MNARLIQSCWATSAVPPLMVVFTALLACGGASPMDELKARSAFDLNCPESQLEFRSLDEDNETYGVIGCGRRAVYVYACAASTDCKWIMNSDATPD